MMEPANKPKLKSLLSKKFIKNLHHINMPLPFAHRRYSDDDDIDEDDDVDNDDNGAVVVKI